MKKIKKIHPLAIRWFHWVNFPVLFLMIWSGLLIYWAESIYGIGWGSWRIELFPVWFYKTLGIPKRLAEGMSLHFFFMWFFAVNGILYVAYTIISGEWRYLIPDKNSFKEAFQVVLHDLHLSKKEPPKIKYNAAQKIAYTTIIIMGLGSLLTGIAIYKPIQFSWLAWMFGGYEWTRWIHFWLTMGYAVFFVIHIVQVAIAGWSNFQAMITGRQLVEEGEAKK
ncbi:MAG: cytochrome b/b6 domain-containing protein [Aridibacter sp.]